MIKPLFFLWLLTTCSMQVYAQTPDQPAPRRPVVSEGPPPTYFLDSVQIIPSDLAELNPNNIASMTTLKINNVHGDGQLSTSTIFIETKRFVRNRYWLIFSQNAAYRKVVPSPGEDDDVLYVLDGKALPEKPEIALAAVNMRSFESVTVIDKAALAKRYPATGKKYGVLVTLKKDR
ncbi:hypothetical protein [Chitinophaga varians]|uniref:hypothetical protein n=1 Tax=Chitinophaga varians TaxID=2202339 RepID=UPI00165F2A27|nr:hypothetical protein [Chitinophaga varians]MBC9909232.1 hypothetical protein [Chitinophaga varians]